MFECKDTPEIEKEKLLADYGAGKKQKKAKSFKTLSCNDARYVVQIEECVQEKSLCDSGADESVLPMRVLHALRQKGINPDVHRFETPVKLQQAIKTKENGSGEGFTASMKVRIKLPCGPLRLRNVDFWVTDQDMDEVLLGRHLLKCIGFDLDQHLASVRRKFDNIDVAEKIAKELNTRLPIHKDKTKRICSIKS